MPEFGDRIAAGNKAQAALDALSDAFQAVEASYTTRLTEIAAEKPWETEKIAKLATAFKISRTVRAQIEAIVADGKLALDGQRFAAQIERIPTHKRNILGL